MNWKVSWTIFHVSDVVQTGSEPDGILRKLCLGWQKIGGASQRLQLWKAICKGFVWSRGSSIFWQHFLFGNSKSLREPWNWLVCFITVLAQKLNRNCMDSCQFVFFRGKEGVADPQPSLRMVKNGSWVTWTCMILWQKGMAGGLVLQLSSPARVRLSPCIIHQGSICHL